MIFKELFNTDISTEAQAMKCKHAWVLKATGLGVTELMLRIMIWLAVRDDRLRGSQMCIVTGPNERLAIDLIDRIKAIFNLGSANIIFETDKRTAIINNVHIEAYPSNHMESMRGLDNVSFVFLDEADFFSKSQQQNARTISERYITKSDPYLVMVSTPFLPDGLFEHIEKESEQFCIYHRLKLNYEYGLPPHGKIYDALLIERQKNTPSFEQEYNCKYLGIIGNIFSDIHIQQAILAGQEQLEITPHIVIDAPKSMGVDPAYGSSNFAIVITQYVDGRIQVCYAEEYERADFNSMLAKCYELIQTHQILKCYIDSANPSFIKSLKRMLGEREDYDQQIADYKRLKWDYKAGMLVIPVAFNKEHREMLGNVKNLLEHQTLAIPNIYGNVITALKTAREEGDGNLDKENTAYNDLFDALRLSLKYYRL